MKKKRLLVVAAATGIVAAIIGIYMMWPGHPAQTLQAPGISRGNFLRLRSGMSLADTKHLFGTASANHASLQDGVLPGASDFVWKGDAGSIVVTFDGHGRPVRSEWVDARNVGPSEVVWLGRRWQEWSPATEERFE
jgi:hypothetical protein